MLGPTPQKNGIFVGMFDIISVQTPSHTRSALVEVGNSLHTPSKLASTPVSGDSRLQKTPMSEGKRFFLDQYTTPRKCDGQDKTPSSISKKYLTPAFFRQYKEAPRDISGEEPSEPKREPWRRPKFMRTLSSMIQDLKKDDEGDVEEDEALDDEMMVLREIEEEEHVAASVQRSKTDSEPAQVLQSAPMDRDGFVASDIREEHTTHPQDQADELEKRQPSKAYKKKGQKRTTRRVRSMSPSIHIP
jgi:hypothetical protein